MSDDEPQGQRSGQHCRYVNGGAAQGTNKPLSPQGMLILMPGMLMVGQATSSLLLYLGLTLFSFGKSMLCNMM